jgi:alpha-glucuronidase
MTLFRVIVVTTVLVLLTTAAYSDDGYRLWLNYQKIDNRDLLPEYQYTFSSVMISGKSQKLRIVSNELEKGCRELLGKEMAIGKSIRTVTLLVGTPKNSFLVRKITAATVLKKLGGEGYTIKSVGIYGHRTVVIAANRDIGLLYGTYHLLRLIQTSQSLENLDIVSTPKIQFRVLNHWDNLDGTVERGYAGKSLWKWDSLPQTTDRRYEDYARANASIGINGTVLNNVNANPNSNAGRYFPSVRNPRFSFRQFLLADLFAIRNRP